MKEPRTPLYKTYQGPEPYAFISYSHADADRVFPVIGALDGSLYRQWYDAGIRAGTNWPEVVASHLMHAGTAVFFLTEQFLRSQYCIREAHYAVSQRIPMICVYLESITLPGDLVMQFSTAIVIHAESSTSEEIAAQLITLLGPSYLGDGVTGYETVSIDHDNKNIWRTVSIVFASFFLLTLLFVVGYLAGWFPFLGAKTVTIDSGVAGNAGKTAQTLEITEFKDSISRDILLRSYEDASLYLCGNTMVNDPSAIRYANGNWYVGEAQTETGSAGVLEAVVQKAAVSYLALANQGIESFDALAGMPQLVYLDISGNPVGDLAFLESLPNLKTLKLIDVAATDYSVLRKLPALESVYVDYASADAVLNALGDSAVDVIVKR